LLNLALHGAGQVLFFFFQCAGPGLGLGELGGIPLFKPVLLGSCLAPLLFEQPVFLSSFQLELLKQLLLLFLQLKGRTFLF
jgi:hypothetical protein